MKNVLISVIIPTYNDAKYIKQAIDSVLNQSFQSFEIVVIDDGSTDNTQHILSPYIMEGKIRYFYQDNKGVAAARNRGILEAKGKYISFLDADDLYLRDSLEKRFKFIARFNLKFIVTDYYLIESLEDLKSLTSLCPVLQKRGFLQLLDSGRQEDQNNNFFIVESKKFANVCLRYIPPKLTTILVEKELLIKNKISFDIRLHRAEDLDFMWKLIACQEIHYIGVLKESTYLYMFNRASHYRNPRYEERLIYYDNLINTMQDVLSREAIAERIYADYWIMYQNASLRSKILLLKKVLFLDPFKLKYWKSFLGLWVKSLMNIYSSKLKN